MRIIAYIRHHRLAARRVHRFYITNCDVGQTTMLHKQPGFVASREGTTKTGVLFPVAPVAVSSFGLLSEV